MYPLSSSLSTTFRESFKRNLFQITCEPDARNCWVISDYAVNIEYRSSTFSTVCLLSSCSFTGWEGLCTGLCKVMGVVVESRWLALQRRGDCVLGHVFHSGYLSHFVSKQATNLGMGLQKERSVTCLSPHLWWRYCTDDHTPSYSTWHCIWRVTFIEEM